MKIRFTFSSFAAGVFLTASVLLMSQPCKAQAAKVPPPTHPVVSLTPADLVARRGLNSSRVDGVDFSYRPLVGTSLIADENFYVLTVLEQTPEALKALLSDPDMEAIRHDVASRVKTASAACEIEIASAGGPVNTQAACAPDAVRWTDAERQRSSEAIGRVYDNSSAVRHIVTEHLRPSGRFQLYAELNDRALLIKAWDDAQSGIDRIIRVYALGEKPRYPDIDSIIYPKDGTYYRSLLTLAIWETSQQADTPAPAYNLPLKFALELLEINKRDDAVRQLRLQETEDVATFKYLASVQWADYKYSAIVVPGWSPVISYEPLNPGRKITLRHAAELFNERLAPVIIVSGARLRPIGTEWTEGFEMKRYLVDELKIPSDHILIQVVSRHTDTEMRDNGRMVFRTGAPIGKKALVLDAFHYIGSKVLEERCVRDMGDVPYTTYDRLDFSTLEFIPSLKALHRDATDPMNP